MLNIHAYCSACTGTDWIFEDLGGIITGAPSVATYNGQVKVIADGSDGTTVWQDTFNNGWSWQPISGPADQPVGLQFGSTFQVIAHATDTGHAVHAWCISCTGSDWTFDDLGSAR